MAPPHCQRIDDVQAAAALAARPPQPRPRTTRPVVGHFDPERTRGPREPDGESATMARLGMAKSVVYQITSADLNVGERGMAGAEHVAHELAGKSGRTFHTGQRDLPDDRHLLHHAAAPRAMTCPSWLPQGVIAVPFARCRLP